MVSVLLLVLFAACSMFVAHADTASGVTAKVTAVSVHQHPWTGLVDVLVTVNCESNDLANAIFMFAAENGATRAALPIAHVTRNGGDSGSETTWTRRFVWDAAADVGAMKLDDVALTVEIDLGVQLWEDGPYWAECNVGASRPEEYGYYFWWGDTVGYKRNAGNDGWVSVKDGYGRWFSDCPTYEKSNSQLKWAGYIDSTGNLVAAHDAATAHLGAPWRMPIDAEFSALISNCDTQWTTRGGVYGRLVTGRGAYASKSIFLPAAGYGGGSYLDGTGSDGHYWSSTPNSGYSSSAWYLNICSSDFYRYGYGSRYGGWSVRPLRGFAK